MDPVSLAAAAVSLVTPYLLMIGKEAAESAAGEAGKSVWSWIKGKLTSGAGPAAVNDFERKPNMPENAQALQAALTKVLRTNSAAAEELASLLKSHSASLSTQTVNVNGSSNEIYQASGGSTIHRSGPPGASG